MRSHGRYFQFSIQVSPERLADFADVSDIFAAFAVHFRQSFRHFRRYAHRAIPISFRLNVFPLLVSP